MTTTANRVLASLNAFFDMRTVLNQDSRPDRMAQFEEEAEKHEILFERMASVPDERSFTSFNKSVLAILQAFIDRGAERLLFMEDDAIFEEGAQFKFAMAASELPENWEMIYLGCNPIGNSGTQKYSERLTRIAGAWTTHAVGLTRKTAQEILDAKINPADPGLMLDDWIARKIHPRGNSYCCRPMLAVQRPGYSDLWGRATDYDDLFKTANRKL